MKKTIVALSLAILALIAARTAWAYTCTGANCTPTISYTEPSTYASGAPLTNLQDGVYTYQINGGSNKQRIIPASKPQGGGVISDTSISEAVAVCTTATLTGSIVMRTAAGGMSTASAHAPLVFDRTKLANGQPDPQCVNPNPATGFSAQ